jgi:hypothetical protein
MSVNFNQIPSPCFVWMRSCLRINLEITQILDLVQKEAGVEIICA